MKAFATFAALIGLLAYALALTGMGSMVGEIASDFGNGAMLTCAVALLFDLHRMLATTMSSSTVQPDDATDRATPDR